jgi:diguanylate cyclase (GGDEF)-like protein/PAS domain S-box-containing protein
LACRREGTPDARPDTAKIAASIHGSLLLDEILVGCLNILKQHFSLGRLSLVQHRTNETTVTLYSLDEGGETSLILPRVISLENSRLKGSLRRARCVKVKFSRQLKPDPIEQSYLVHGKAAAVIYTPLLLAGKLNGMLVISHNQSEPLTASQNTFLRHVVSHLSLAIENSNVLYYERRRSRQLQMLSEIAKLAVLLEDLTQFLEKASSLLRQGFDYDVVQIWAIGPRQDLILGGYAHKAPPGTTLRTGIPLMVEECRRKNEMVCNNNLSGEAKASTSHPKTASQLAVPIRLRGKLLGILSIESSRLDAFSAEDFGIIEAMASLIASAFDNLRTFEHSQQSNDYMRAILDSAVDRAILSTDINGYVITSSAGSQAIFRLSAQQILGRQILTLFSDRRFQRELALYMNTPEVPTLERSRLTQSAAGSVALLDVIAQRVYDVEGRPIGFLCIIRDLTENIQLQQTLENLSFTDELTGFYNQRRFFVALTEEIERSRRYRRGFSLCFLDLDGFKKYNDTQGHLRGDQALKETASLLRTMVRGYVDTYYRYGGDEFTIIMPETSRRNAQIVVERIRRALHEHFRGLISVSIGIAEYTEPMTAEELVEKADRAMYESKSQGGNCVVFAK